MLNGIERPNQIEKNTTAVLTDNSVKIASPLVNINFTDYLMKSSLLSGLTLEKSDFDDLYNDLYSDL